MPLLVKSSVGSLAGTSGADGTMVCPFEAKYSRNLLRMSAAFMRIRSSKRTCASRSGRQKKRLTVFEFNMLAQNPGTAYCGGARNSFRIADTEKPRACKYRI